MSAPRQPRILILRDFMAAILILSVVFKSESKAPDVRMPFTVLQCTTLPSHEYPLFEKEESYERPDRTFRRSLNGRELFLVCTDRVSR